MPDIKDCAEAIVEAAGGDLDAEAVANIKERTKAILSNVKRLEKRGLAGEDELNKQIAEEVNRAKQAVLIKRRVTAEGIRHYADAKGAIDSKYADRPGKGLRAMVQGLAADIAGAKNSLMAKVQTMRDAKVAAFYAELKQAGLEKLYKSGTHDLEIRKIRADQDAGKDISKYSAVGRKMADITHRHLELLRTERNQAGAWIGKLPGYVSRQSHDQYLIRQAKEKTWKEDFGSRIDWDRSMPDLDPAERDKALNVAYNHFATGSHVSYEDMGSPRTGLSFANFGKRNTAERVWHFKSPEDEHAYFQEYGTGRNLFENVVHQLDLGGRDLAVLRELGPTAGLVVRRLYEHYHKKLSEGTDTAGALKELNHEYDNITRRLWPVITGEGATNDTNAWTHLNNIVLTVESMADLGGVALTHITNIAGAASMMNHFGDGTKGGFYKQTADITASLVKGMFHGIEGEEQKIASECGFLQDGVHLPFLTGVGESVGSGAFARAGDMFQKVTGITRLTNRMRINSIMATANSFATRAVSTFAELPLGMQRAFRQYGINDKAWDVIRGAEVSKIGERPVLTSANILDLDHSEFKSVAGDAASEAQLQRTRTQIADAYRNLLMDKANATTSRPNARTRAILRAGIPTNTAQGFLLRHLMFYHSYATTFGNTHLARELHGYTSDIMTNREALFRMFTGKGQGSLQGMTGLIGGAMFFGYVSYALKEMAAGRQPSVPTTPDGVKETLMNSLQHSGALGLYGDMFAQDVTNQTSGADWFSRHMGTTVGRAINTFDIGHDVVQGKWTPAKEQALRLFYNSTPGHNLFYSRWLTDYYIYQKLLDLNNPGYIQRSAAANKGRGTPYFSPADAGLPR